MHSTGAGEKLIFILGILPRCGTNFLSNLLLLHPDCEPPDPVWEDYLLAHSNLLQQYSDSVSGHWDTDWGITGDERKQLEVSLGEGLASFLCQRCKGTRVVSKTPRVDELGSFFRFFPAAKLLILVRDGRSVIESGVRTFGWRREPALHSLADAAATISNFQQSASPYRDSYRVIRYEDLWRDTETELRRLFSFLELDPEFCDFEQARLLPVRGSSELATASKQELHWDPVEKAAEFDPISRFADWSNARHFRYNHVAGQAMQELGYECKDVKNPGGMFQLQGMFLDAAWLLKSLLRPLYCRIVRS